MGGYNEYRQQCKDSGNKYGMVSSFSELTNGGFLSDFDVRLLESVYDSVDDIDLFVGGMLETPQDDGLVGPVFRCIIGDTFTRLKLADRFWFENGHQVQDSPFSLAQLEEVRKSSMARLMCDNTDISRAQPLLFRTPTRGNEFLDCNDTISIASLNFD